MLLDVCGKCGGQNDTCKLVRGRYNQSARAEGYRTVVRIPAGSSNLDIRQHGNGRLHDDNYLGNIHTEVITELVEELMEVFLSFHAIFYFFASIFLFITYISRLFFFSNFHDI